MDTTDPIDGLTLLERAQRLHDDTVDIIATLLWDSGVLCSRVVRKSPLIFTAIEK